MSTTNPLLFLEAHTPDIKAQYRQANPDRYRKFKSFLEELTAMARTLSRNKEIFNKKQRAWILLILFRPKLLRKSL